MSLEAAARLASSYTNLAKLALDTGSSGNTNKFFGNNIDYAAITRALQSVSEQLACGSCGSTAAAGTPYPDPNASGGVHGVLCEACYNRRHRRGGNSNSVLNSKAKQRRRSQETDEVDDDSLAAELLVSTVKNLRCLCAIMLDGASEDDESSASDEDTDPEVSFSPKSAASILSAGVGGISVLKSSAMGKVINGSSKQHRRAAEKKCLEKLRGFSNALNNISQRPQQQQLQLTLLDKRRQASHQTVLQHQGPTQVQRHHLMTIPSTITLTPSSANTPSNRVRQPVSVHGGNLKSGRLGGVVFNRRDSISLPPSPTRSMLIKKETLVSSGNGEPIVIHQPIALPQVPLALHQSIIQQQPRQYIHIKTEPNLTAAASNIPAQLNSTNISTANTSPSNISTSASNTKVSPEGKNVILKTSGLPVGANAQKEVDLSAIDQCDNSNTSPSSISPNSITGNSKRKGCRCGNATSMPGKLTCCGQRCPCYVDAKACFECKCKGCRNPHRPNGEKRPHSTATESSSSKTSKKAEKRSVVVSSSSTLDNQTTVPTKLYIKSGSSAGTQAMVKRVHLGK